MHPSNYTQMGRRRLNSKEEDSCPSTANHLAANDYGSIKRSRSGSDVTHNTNYERCLDVQKLPNCHSHPDICGSANDRELEWDPFKSESDGTHQSLIQRNSSEGVRSDVLNQDSCVTSRIRRRSGSWSGVNESDEDLEQMVYPPNPPIQIIGSNIHSASVSSAHEILEEFPRPCSYQSNCDNFCSTTDTIPGSTSCCHSEERMKRKLKFFFMNPVEKWVAKRRIPCKLLVQIIKIVIVTAQLCMFASQRYNHVTYLSDTKVTFSHLFINGWDASREVTAYPPASGPLALYKVEDFYKFLDFAIEMFFSVKEKAIGSYHFEEQKNGISLPKLCFSHFDHKIAHLERTESVENGSASENQIIKKCVNIPFVDKNANWSTKRYLEEQNSTIDFDLLLYATFNFRLKTTKIKASVPYEFPECYRLDAVILLNNADQDGQMLVDLDVEALILDCKGSVPVRREETEYHKIRTGINIVTIIICLLSLLMCLRAIYRAQVLRRCTNEFFKSHFLRPLTWWERFEFINLWYVLICINDLFIIIGSSIKVGLETQRGYIDTEGLGDPDLDYEGYLDKWNICSLFLGLGNLFVWFGCLRYLGFFKTYNVLILTIKNCFPNVVRYSICILMVFAGYSFCGWLVLGPYHLKFRSLSSTIECLYSLINGDDMYATFASTEGKDSLVWWFSRIYLYTFISLFIYVILSLFIAIIMDAYDTIKSYYQHGFPHSQLMQFANECCEDPNTGVFHDEEERTIQDVVSWVCCCCKRPRQSRDGYEPLPT